MATQGMTDAQIMAAVDGRMAAAPPASREQKPLSAGGVFWGVFGALLAFALVAVIVSFIMSMMNSAAP